MSNAQLPWIHSLKVIGWDLDGTLYPSSAQLNTAIHVAKIAAVADALGTNKQAAAVRFAEQYQVLGSNTAVLETFGIPGEQFFLDLWNSLPLSEFIAPNPVLAHQLQNLAKVSNIPQVILTNSNSQKTVLLKLSAAHIPHEVFDSIYTSVELGVTKPHLSAFAPLYERHGCLPEQVLYVGDRIETDLEPAQKLGIKTAYISDRDTNEPGFPWDMFGKDAADICMQLVSKYSA